MTDLQELGFGSQLYDDREIDDFLAVEEDDDENDEPEYEHIEWGVVNPTEESHFLVVDVTYVAPAGIGQWMFSQVDLLYNDGWQPAWFCGEDGFEFRFLHAQTSSVTSWVLARVEARAGWAGAQDKSRFRDIQRLVEKGMGVVLIMHDKLGNVNDGEELVVDYPGLLIGNGGFATILTEEHSAELSKWVYQFGYEDMAHRYYIPHRERA